MNISELFSLTHWVNDEVVSKQIPQKYQELQSILQQHVQPNQAKAPFDTQRNNLIEALRNAPLYMLTKDQLAFLHKLDIAQALGEEGIETINDILYKNVLDVATSAEKLQQIIEHINQGIERSNQIMMGLEGCIVEEEYELTNEVLMRVSFTGGASMSNIVEFKKWGNNWHEIGRGIAFAHGVAPEDVKIVGATNGSIIIELAVGACIAHTASKIILRSLEIAEKIINMRKMIKEIRCMNLQEKKLAENFEGAVEKEKESCISNILAEMTEELGIKIDSEGDKITALEKAVKNLVNFIESGGEVDFVMPAENLEDEENENAQPDYKELRNNFQEIRQLEDKLKLLECKESE